ncbi:MAG: hypothetical protein HY718_12705 [Planctomycetes bacterium]|nr:hypothetical protein [Planctomycetota bacterium]
MVAKILVDDNITAGRRLIEELDREMDIPAALWLYLPEPDRWRLVLASDEVESNGPRAVYAHVQEVLSRMEDEQLPRFEDISVVSPRDRVIQAIASAVKTGRGFSKIRLTGNSLNNTYIDDAVVYRMDVR